jgi:hypothetical protein
MSQYQGDTCHHSQGDTWHQVTSSLTWQHGKTTRGCTRSTVADCAVRRVTWQQVDQSDRDTCQALIGEKRVPRGPLWGSHVAPHGWMCWRRRGRGSVLLAVAFGRRVPPRNREHGSGFHTTRSGVPLRQRGRGSVISAGFHTPPGRGSIHHEPFGRGSMEAPMEPGVRG